jgi:hypothetical protein
MRRCAIYYGHAGHEGDISYTGWLVSVYSTGYSEFAVCVNDKGLMRSHPLHNVRLLQVPTRVDLFSPTDGAPRRGVHGDGLPADEN